MKVAFKFEGYRVLLVHNQEDFWDDIHLRLVGTDCTLFAVNSAKDAFGLIEIMPFDIIISDSNLSDASGLNFLQTASTTNKHAVGIMHHKKADGHIRWHVMIEEANALDQKYLEIYGMLSILSDPANDRHEWISQYFGGVFNDLQPENTVSLQ
jgi:CheY-like chemotaxis protein